MSTKTGLDALVTPEDSVLLLIDHQPAQFANLPPVAYPAKRTTWACSG
jgi:hypothetical protein